MPVPAAAPDTALALMPWGTVMKTSTRADTTRTTPGAWAPVPSRRRALAALAAAGSPLLLRWPAAAASPFTASLTAKKVAGQKVRSTVKATVAMTGLNWSGTLGTWDVPEGGKRQVTVQPPGMPAPFDLRLEHLMQNQFMSMTLMLELYQQEMKTSASTKVG